MNDELRILVKKCKQQVGISYLEMSKQTNISYSMFSKFVVGDRNLSEEKQLIVKAFLKKYI